MRRSRKIKPGRRLLIGVGVEGGGARGAEVEEVVGSGVVGEGVVGEVSRRPIRIERGGRIVRLNKRHEDTGEHRMWLSQKRVRESSGSRHAKFPKLRSLIFLC